MDWLTLHPQTPQKRALQRAAEVLKGGGVIALPTDGCYALAAHLDDREAAERLRRIRQFDKHHQFTLMCRDLSDISRYAKVDNWQFRILKQLTPGAFTFVLPASKELPKRLSHEKRKTIGIRVPDHPVAQQLLEALNEPLICSTLQLPDDDSPIANPNDARKHLERLLDLVLDWGDGGAVPTTVLDLCDEAGVQLLRQGRGDASALGF